MAKNEPRQVRSGHIIAAAIEEFTEKGYEGASMDRIAARAGISKGCVYHHFPSKEILLLRSNERMSEQIFLLMKDAENAESPLEGLREYMKSYISFFRSRPSTLAFLFLSMAKSIGNQELSDYYRSYAAQASAFFEKMFQRSLERGELNGIDPEAWGISLMSALDGLAAIAAIQTESDTAGLLASIEKVWLGDRTV